MQVLMLRKYKELMEIHLEYYEQDNITYNVTYSNLLRIKNSFYQLSSLLRMFKIISFSQYNALKNKEDSIFNEMYIKLVAIKDSKDKLRTIRKLANEIIMNKEYL